MFGLQLLTTGNLIISIPCMSGVGGVGEGDNGIFIRHLLEQLIVLPNKYVLLLLGGERVKKSEFIFRVIIKMRSILSILYISG